MTSGFTVLAPQLRFASRGSGGGGRAVHCSACFGAATTPAATTDERNGCDNSSDHACYQQLFARGIARGPKQASRPLCIEKACVLMNKMSSAAATTGLGTLRLSVNPPPYAADLHFDGTAVLGVGLPHLCAQLPLLEGLDAS